jgi:hypothetical protein
LKNSKLYVRNPSRTLYEKNYMGDRRHGEEKITKYLEDTIDRCID